MHVAALLALLLAWSPAFADDLVQLDPFVLATHGLAGCPEFKPRLYSTDELRTEAHVRAERGTRCALEGTCEPGGAYKRDPEINERVRAAIAGDRVFKGTALWVTTSRKWVTLEGCVPNAGVRRSLIRFVEKVQGVERVFDRTRLSAPSSH